MEAINRVRLLAIAPSPTRTPQRLGISEPARLATPHGVGQQVHSQGHRTVAYHRPTEDRPTTNGEFDPSGEARYQGLMSSLARPVCDGIPEAAHEMPMT